MYGKSSLESNWPEPWSFVGGSWRRVRLAGGGARQAAALVMDRVGSHGFAAEVDTSGLWSLYTVNNYSHFIDTL